MQKLFLLLILWGVFLPCDDVKAGTCNIVFVGDKLVTVKAGAIDGLDNMLCLVCFAWTYGVRPSSKQRNDKKPPALPWKHGTM